MRVDTILVGLRACGLVDLWACGSAGLRACGPAGLWVCRIVCLWVCNCGLFFFLGKFCHNKSLFVRYETIFGVSEYLKKKKNL